MNEINMWKKASAQILVDTCLLCMPLLVYFAAFSALQDCSPHTEKLLSGIGFCVCLFVVITCGLLIFFYIPTVISLFPQFSHLSVFLFRFFFLFNEPSLIFCKSKKQVIYF